MRWSGANYQLKALAQAIPIHRYGKSFALHSGKAVINGLNPRCSGNELNLDGCFRPLGGDGR